jgi:DNA-binding transcriptional MerR regulator/effector-binding domain-containing protein
MGSRVGIVDFSVMTSLSRNALRQYHDLGLLVPSHIDAHTGYRLYDTSQVDLARIIRRLRELGMSIPDLKALLSADDIAVRYRIIAAQLHRIETELQHTQDVVCALRGLLKPVHDQANIALRHEPSTRGWAVTASISFAEIDSWSAAALRRLGDALQSSGIHADGPPGALLERQLFTESYGAAIFLIPVTEACRPPSYVSEWVLPEMDVAVITHHGRHSHIDRSYAKLGTYVSEHLIGEEGPIREYYLGSTPTDFATIERTEICWPIFSTVRLPIRAPALL